MKKLCLLTTIFSFLSIEAIGSVPQKYQVNMRLFLEGKLVSSPQIVLQEAMMEMEENDIQLYKMAVKVTRLSEEKTTTKKQR